MSFCVYNWDNFLLVILMMVSSIFINILVGSICPLQVAKNITLQLSIWYAYNV